MFPSPDRLSVCFAHAAYEFLDGAETPWTCRQARDPETLARLLPGADVLVISGMWRSEMLAAAPRLRLVQSISAGTERFDRAAFAAAGVRLASASGANARAVAEHTLALMLALTRRVAEARDNQRRHFWRGMQSNRALREDELAGKTLLVVGLGTIGSRVARLARAFEMHVIGIRRDPARGAGDAHEVHGLAALPAQLARADIVALTCPLTAETAGLIDAAALAALKPSALLVNCARGGVVVREDLCHALALGTLAGAALDVTTPEPLAPDDPLWDVPNLLLTPHSAGECRTYEADVRAILAENIARLGRGETALLNQVV